MCVIFTQGSTQVNSVVNCRTEIHVKATMQVTRLLRVPLNVEMLISCLIEKNKVLKISLVASGNFPPQILYKITRCVLFTFHQTCRQG